MVEVCHRYQGYIFKNYLFIGLVFYDSRELSCEKLQSCQAWLGGVLCAHSCVCVVIKCIPLRGVELGAAKTATSEIAAVWTYHHPCSWWLAGSQKLSRFPNTCYYRLHDYYMSDTVKAALKKSIFCINSGSDDVYYERGRLYWWIHRKWSPSSPPQFVLMSFSFIVLILQPATLIFWFTFVRTTRGEYNEAINAKDRFFELNWAKILDWLNEL